MKVNRCLLIYNTNSWTSSQGYRWDNHFKSFVNSYLVEYLIYILFLIGYTNISLEIWPGNCVGLKCSNKQTNKYTHSCLHTFTHTHTHTHTHAHARGRACACTHARTHARTHALIACTHACTHAHKWTHVHTESLLVFTKHHTTQTTGWRQSEGGLVNYIQ